MIRLILDYDLISIIEKLLEIKFYDIFAHYFDSWMFGMG